MVVCDLVGKDRRVERRKGSSSVLRPDCAPLRNVTPPHARVLNAYHATYNIPCGQSRNTSWPHARAASLDLGALVPDGLGAGAVLGGDAPVGLREQLVEDGVRVGLHVDHLVEGVAAALLGVGPVAGQRDVAPQADRPVLLVEVLHVRPLGGADDGDGVAKGARRHGGASCLEPRVQVPEVEEREQDEGSNHAYLHRGLQRAVEPHVHHDERRPRKPEDLRERAQREVEDAWVRPPREDDQQRAPGAAHARREPALVGPVGEGQGGGSHEHGREDLDQARVGEPDLVLLRLRHRQLLRRLSTCLLHEAIRRGR
mmetsp:Transcript_123869/g.361717  ORF Transcript_123869/g.361717 Transcript_123869/m.361717 type:complete len:313 (-) Transcript_123869:91-1029(-)